jgi:hypothetical protein
MSGLTGRCFASRVQRFAFPGQASVDALHLDAI